MGKKRGTKCKLTPEIHKKIVQALLAGNYVQVACNFAGIVPSTFYDWVKRGEKGQAEFVEFSNAVRDALAQSEIKLVVSIEKHANGRPKVYDKSGRLVQEEVPSDWRAAITLLERKFPERWGRREHVKTFAAKEGEEFKPKGDFEKLLEMLDELEEK